MSWTAVIESSREAPGGRLDTLVVLDNGHGETFRQRFFHDGALPSLQQEVLRWIDARESRPAKLANLAPGTALDCTVPVARAEADVPPTPEQVARRDFRLAWQRYVALRAALDAGLISATNKQLTDTTDEIRARWQPAYLDLLGR